MHLIPLQGVGGIEFLIILFIWILPLLVVVLITYYLYSINKNVRSINRKFEQLIENKDE